jgi:hypothetical protein
MAEPENHDFPDAVGVISDAYDTAQDGLRAAASAGAVPEYAKLGNVTSLFRLVHMLRLVNMKMLHKILVSLHFKRFLVG